MNKSKKSYNLSGRAFVITVSDLVVFPNMIISLFIGKDRSINAIEKLTKKNNQVIMLTQRDVNVSSLTERDLYNVGCLVEILQIVKMPDSTLKVLIKGIAPVNIDSLYITEKFIETDYSVVEDDKKYEKKKLTKLRKTLLDMLSIYEETTKKIQGNIVSAIKKFDSLQEVVNSLASHLPIAYDEKQKILESVDLIEKTVLVESFLEVELDLLNVEKRIKDRVKQQMEKNQKDYYLNEQIKAIQKELNSGEEIKDEAKELIDLLRKTKLPKEGKTKIEAEIRKLSMMSPMSAEASVVRSYIEWVLGLPWKKYSKINTDLLKAEEILNRDHYSLEEVKERILEYLAVVHKSGNLKSQILCLVGPPGVGKTSLVKSIAEASGREYIRIALGGIRDEAEIRGHRRTYIGAMPGRLIQSIKKAKVSNPLILLDEIDKMGSDFRGDPASALLEVLDAEQNSHFVDNYIEIEYDLSDVMFIVTANSLQMQDALLDRLDIIELSGYSDTEKFEIARRHLVSKKMKEAALEDKDLQITNGALLKIIRNYTRESGVRELERMIAKVSRKVTRDIVQKKIKSTKITEKNVEQYAGVPKFKDSNVEKDDLIGVTTGLAWTRVGGDILYIEALKMKGKGEVKITGKLGEVMQESIKAAYSLVKVYVDQTVPSNQLADFDIHIHVPEGAIPKDGPSAGVAMVTSIFSAITGIKVRSDTSMTGEITLRGKILPIGGLKEKLLASLRFGIKNVIIPKDNEKDLHDLPKSVLDQLNIIKVSHFTEVLQNALTDNRLIKQMQVQKNSVDYQIVDSTMKN